MTDKITNPEILVKKAKDILKNVTPLKSDCGKMCGKLCCKGPDEKGMRLFPGEKVTDNKFKIIGNTVFCGGNCERVDRPLSCIIFPFFPVMTEKNADIRFDLRAYSICLLVNGFIKPDRKFVRAVFRAEKYLFQSPEIKKFIDETNEEIDDAEKLTELLFGK